MVASAGDERNCEDVFSNTGPAADWYRCRVPIHPTPETQENAVLSSIHLHIFRQVLLIIFEVFPARVHSVSHNLSIASLRVVRGHRAHLPLVHLGGTLGYSLMWPQNRTLDVWSLW